MTNHAHAAPQPRQAVFPDHCSRRAFAAMGLGSLAALALTGRVRAQAPAAPAPGDVPVFFQWQDVAAGVRVAPEFGGNTLVLASGREAMLVDTKNAGIGSTLRREAAAAGAEVTMVVNTHHHRDHIGGNLAFAGLPVLAHKNAVPRIPASARDLKTSAGNTLKDLDRVSRVVAPQVRTETTAEADAVAALAGASESFAPTRTIDADQETIRVGELDVVLRHFGIGHTDNDLVVHVPALNVIHVGDLCFNKLHPFVDRSTGSTSTQWQAVLRQVIELCDDKTVVVPGHGLITDRAGLQQQIEYFDIVREAVRQARDNEGKEMFEVSTIVPGPVSDYGFQQLLARTLMAIYQELDDEAEAANAPKDQPAAAPKP